MYLMISSVSNSSVSFIYAYIMYVAVCLSGGVILDLLTCKLNNLIGCL